MTQLPMGFGEQAFAQDDLSLMKFIAQQAVNGMATATLVEVIAVHDETVDVRPLVAQIDGANTGIPHGTIHDLPFFALRAGPCEIRIKPRVGDKGAALFCHNDISAVKESKAQANPGSRRRFDWSDGLYFGGFLPTGTPTTIIEIDADNNVAITATTIKIAGNVEVTGDLSATGTITGTTDVIGGGKHLKTHTHGGVTTGSGTSGPPS